MDGSGKQHKGGSEPGLVTLAKWIVVVLAALTAASAAITGAHSWAVLKPIAAEAEARKNADDELRAGGKRTETLIELLAVMQVEPPNSARYREAQTMLRGLVRYRIQ